MVAMLTGSPTYKSNGKTVCYMASTPIKAEGRYSKRGHIYALVTHHPDADSKSEFSIVTGYTYKPDSEVEVRIGGRKFSLFTEKDRAWTPDAKTDAIIVNAMIKGNKMTVVGVSSRGTKPLIPIPARLYRDQEIDRRQMPEITACRSQRAFAEVCFQ